MSGAEGPGNATALAEFNAHADPEALAILAAAGPPLTLVPLEAGRAVRASPARIAALAGAGTGRALGTAAALLAARADRNGGGPPLYDPLAIAWLLRPRLFRARPVALAVDTGPGPARGRTLFTPAAEHPEPRVRLLAPVDPDGFFALLAERLARLP